MPIAICGIALRLPGGVRDTEAFWQVLQDGKDLRSEIPESRFNASGFNKSAGLKGAFDIQHGYFLEEDLACLDASFFTVGKAELEKMDPKERQMLEVTRECLESAGETGYHGKRIGCYMGTFGDDWFLLQSKENLQSTGGYRMGLDLFLANRISYEYNFKGPRYVQ
jgi:acyl transferase domain-containing protein